MDQRESVEWLYVRKNRIAASICRSICKARIEKRLISVIKDIILPKPLDHVLHIRHSILNETVALKKYRDLTDFETYASGLQVHPAYQYIAGSPDALVGLDGILEIKCPFLIRNGSIRIMFTWKAILLRQ